jgi:hypothetical protein
MGAKVIAGDYRAVTMASASISTSQRGSSSVPPHVRLYTPSLEEPCELDKRAGEGKKKG